MYYALFVKHKYTYYIAVLEGCMDAFEPTNCLMKGAHCHLHLCLNCFYRLVKISVIGTLRNNEKQKMRKFTKKLQKIWSVFFMDTQFKLNLLQ